MKLGPRIKFKKAKLPSKKKLIGKYTVVEPLNIKKHAKDLYLNYSKDKKISFGPIYRMGHIKHLRNLGTG